MFRFTIRDVLWLMVVVGLAFASPLALEKYLFAAGIWQYEVGLAGGGGFGGDFFDEVFGRS
jgi:hypothetical protein